MEPLPIPPINPREPDGPLEPPYWDDEDDEEDY